MSFNLKDRLNDIYDGLSERIKSPFILTFAVVWTLRHWELIYALFNFNSYYDLKDKLGFIKDNLKKEDSCSLFWSPFGWTFVSIISYYLIQFASEGIVLLYKKWVRPFLYNLIDRNKIATKFELEVEKKNFKRIDAKNKELESRIKDYSSNEELLQKEINDLLTNVRELQNEKRDFDSRISIALDESMKKDTEIQKLNGEISKTAKDLIDTQRQLGEVSTDLTTIFKPGELWTCLRLDDHKTTKFTFHINSNGDFFYSGEKTIYHISNIQIRPIKRLIEFNASPTDKQEPNVRYTLLLINDKFLIGSSGIYPLIYFIKGDHKLPDKNNSSGIFFDYNSLFT